MKDNEIRINLTNNRANVLSLTERQYLCAIGHQDYYKEQRKLHNAPKLTYYYNLKTKYGEGGGDGGNNLIELCKRLKDSLNFHCVKEKELIINLETKINQESFHNEGIIDIEKINIIKLNLSKEFGDIKIKN